MEKVHVVPEQKPDGNFLPVPTPIRRRREALLRGLALCRELETPDLLLATDPDCDRLGIAVRQLDKERERYRFRLTRQRSRRACWISSAQTEAAGKACSNEDDCFHQDGGSCCLCIRC